LDNFYDQLWFRPEATGPNFDVGTNGGYAVFLDDFKLINCDDVGVDPLVDSVSPGRISLNADDVDVEVRCVSNPIPVRHQWTIHEYDTDNLVAGPIFSGKTANSVIEYFNQGMEINVEYYVKHGIYTTQADEGCRIRWTEDREFFEVEVGKSLNGNVYYIQTYDRPYELSKEYLKEMDRRAFLGELDIAERSNESDNKISVDNYPNPFSNSTTIEYTLESQGTVSINVLNNNGQVIETLLNNVLRDSGNHQVVFDRKNLSSGIYFYRITAGDFSQTKKMILID